MADTAAEVGTAEVLVEVEAGALVGSAADQPAAAALEAVGEAVMNNLFTECFSVSALLALVEPNPNRAPIAVFIGLGIALAIVLVVLFFAVPASGEDYRSGGTNYYSGPFGGFGHFGGFGGYL